MAKEIWCRPKAFKPRRSWLLPFLVKKGPSGFAFLVHFFFLGPFCESVDSTVLERKHQVIMTAHPSMGTLLVCWEVPGVYFLVESTQMTQML